MYNPQLDTFVTVAERGSFTKAAEELCITPTAVIKQINLLEAKLGLKLFERSHRGLKLTANEREFTAWGTGNRLTPADSYFVRLDGLPDALVFGPLPDGDAADLFVLPLC